MAKSSDLEVVSDFVCANISIRMCDHRVPICNPGHLFE